MDLFELQKQQQASKLEYRPSFTESANQKPGSRSESPASVKPVPPSSVPQSLWDNVAHKRSSSEDLQRTQHGETFEPIKPEYSNSLKEPLNSPKDSSRTEKVSRVTPPHTSHGSGNWEASVPLHLLSATNQHKISAHAHPTPQQLPSKLSSSMSSAKSSGSSLSQMLPFKLSSSRGVPSSGGGSPPLTSNKPFLGQMPKRGSAMELSMTAKVTPEHFHHSPPATSPATTSAPRMSLSRSQSHMSTNKARLNPQQSPHSNILPMKLAERNKGQNRAKSASPSSQVAHRHLPSGVMPEVNQGQMSQSQDTPKSSKHSHQEQQKSSRKEPEIIYF